MIVQLPQGFKAMPNNPCLFCHKPVPPLNISSLAICINAIKNGFCSYECQAEYGELYEKE